MPESLPPHHANDKKKTVSATDQLPRKPWHKAKMQTSPNRCLYAVCDVKMGKVIVKKRRRERKCRRGWDIPAGQRANIEMMAAPARPCRKKYQQGTTKPSTLPYHNGRFLFAHLSRDCRKTRQDAMIWTRTVQSRENDENHI